MRARPENPAAPGANEEFLTPLPHLRRDPRESLFFGEALKDAVAGQAPGKWRDLIPQIEPSHHLLRLLQGHGGPHPIAMGHPAVLEELPVAGEDDPAPLGKRDQFRVGYPGAMHRIEAQKPKEPREFSQMRIASEGHVAQAAGLPLFFVDERWTTQEVERAMREAGAHPSRQKEKVDVLSAVLILQAWLDARSRV